jgi:hypothetical protein
MSISSFLAASSASDEFREAIGEFLATGEPNDRVRFDPRSPPVKVERTLVQLLASRPDLQLESVEVDGRSGCENFHGSLYVATPDGPVVIGFEWNCRWKAEQLGWTDWFGFPDQSRAAREFGYDCFLRWEEVDSPERSAA